MKVATGHAARLALSCSPPAVAGALLHARYRARGTQVRAGNFTAASLLLYYTVWQVSRSRHPRASSTISLLN